jgi:hypothetical protein
VPQFGLGIATDMLVCSESFFSIVLPNERVVLCRDEELLLLLVRSLGLQGCKVHALMEVKLGIGSAGSTEWERLTGPLSSRR